MGRGGGTGTSGTVGGRRGHRQVAGLQQGTGNRVGGHPDRNGGKTGCNRIRDNRFLIAEYGQRAGPEGIHQFLRAFRERTERFQLRLIMNMHDQRIIRRTSLCGKNG